MTTNEWQQEPDQIIEQGKKVAAGIGGSGKMLIDSNPQGGFFRVRLRSVQPPELVPQFISGFCEVLAKGGTMFNLQVKHRIRTEENGSDK